MIATPGSSTAAQGPHRRVIVYDTTASPNGKYQLELITMLLLAQFTRNLALLAVISGTTNAFVHRPSLSSRSHCASATLSSKTDQRFQRTCQHFLSDENNNNNNNSEDRLRQLGYSDDEIRRSNRKSSSPSSSPPEEIKVRVDLVDDVDPVTLTAVGFALIALNFLVFANLGDGGISGFVATIINSF
jgi:hypothetical protein